MRNKNELNPLKAEAKTKNTKLAELNDDELEPVVGGGIVEVTSAKMLENLTAADVGSKILYNGVIYYFSYDTEKFLVFRNDNGGCIYVTKYP